jgi:hypothetical protein
MIGDYSCIMCVTTWGAVLAVNHINSNLVNVYAPNTIDSGQIIRSDEIVSMWKILLYSDCFHPQYPAKEWAKLKQIF